MYKNAIECCFGIRSLHPGWIQSPQGLTWSRIFDILRLASQRNWFSPPGKWPPWSQMDFLHCTSDWRTKTVSKETESLYPLYHRSDKTTLASPRSAKRRSATNSMYCFIRQQFIPIKSTGKASVRNSCNQKHVAFASFDQDFPVWFVHGHGKAALTDLLNANGFSDDVLYSVLWRLLHQVAVEQAGKCTVQALKNNIYAITIGLTLHSW